MTTKNLAGLYTTAGGTWNCSLTYDSTPPPTLNARLERMSGTGDKAVFFSFDDSSAKLTDDKRDPNIAEITAGGTNVAISGPKRNASGKFTNDVVFAKAGVYSPGPACMIG